MQYIYVHMYAFTLFQHAGCHADPPVAPAPDIVVTRSADFRDENGSVSYACPANMTTRAYESVQVVTCTKCAARFKFLPARVQDCDGECSWAATYVLECDRVTWSIITVQYTLQIYSRVYFSLPNSVQRRASCSQRHHRLESNVSVVSG